MIILMIYNDTQIFQLCTALYIIGTNYTIFKTFVKKLISN